MPVCHRTALRVDDRRRAACMRGFAYVDAGALVCAQLLRTLQGITLPTY